MRFEYDFSATGANDGRITGSRSYSLTNLTETVSYTYDAAGRVISVALPNGAGTTTTTYTGNVTRVTSPAERDGGGGFGDGGGQSLLVGRVELE